MNKKLLIAALTIAIVVGAGIVYVLLQKNIKIEPSKTTESTKVEASPRVNSPHTAKGSYVDYTDEGFASTQGTRLLFFHAPWCPQCRALDEVLRQANCLMV